MFNNLLNWGFLGMGVGMVVYYFRGRVKRMLLGSIIYSLKIVVLCHNYLTKRDDSIIPKGVIYMEGDEKYIIHEYDIICNNKLHEMCFISERYDNEKVNKKLMLLNENKEAILAQKYKFLHCSLINRGGECVKDVTQEMRSFMFYFKDGDYVCDVKYVLEYIKSKNSDLDISECDLLFYMNDDEFTERIIKLGDKDILLHKIIENY